jgi:DNA-binding NarL/FixJ family response regulator
LFVDGEEHENTPDLRELRQGLNMLEHMASDMLYSLQEAGSTILLAELPDGSVAEMLSALVENTAESLSLSSRVTSGGRWRPLAEFVARLLYTIAREVLAQVSQHQGTRRLRLNLEYRRHEVALEISDDGVPTVAVTEGTDESNSPYPGIASLTASEPLSQSLRELRRMVEGLGGALEVESNIEQGTRVQVRIPYSETHDEHSPEHSHGYGEGTSHFEQADGANVGQSTPPSSGGQPARISVLLVSNQAVTRAGLRRLLESYPDLDVVGEVGDSVQAVSETVELLPRVLVVDAPEAQALETLRQVRQLHAETGVLILADTENEALLYATLRAGASGFVLKEIAPDELVQAVRTVARGEALVQPNVAARLLAIPPEQRGLQESLTAREREVLHMLARGLRNKEIAERLTLSERTVNFHLANIYAKLHVSGRTEALSRALQLGLLKT